MILGTLVGLQNSENYHKAIGYMLEAEKIQEYLILAKERQNRGAEMGNKIFEDQLILAFRQYTRGIISYNYFVMLDDESRHKF